MRLLDLLRFTLLALSRQRFRSSMLLTAVGLGVGAVVVLTALGEGARGYVLGEFAFLGKDTVIIIPGRKETTGGMPPLTGVAAHDITLEEVEVLPKETLEEIARLRHESRSSEEFVKAREAFIAKKGSPFGG